MSTLQPEEIEPMLRSAAEACDPTAREARFLKTAEYIEGIRAHIAGLKLHENPYRSRTLRADSWEHGWEKTDWLLVGTGSERINASSLEQEAAPPSS